MHNNLSNNSNARVLNWIKTRYMRVHVFVYECVCAYAWGEFTAEEHKSSNGFGCTLHCHNNWCTHWTVNKRPLLRNARHLIQHNIENNYSVFRARDCLQFLWLAKARFNFSLLPLQIGCLESPPEIACMHQHTPQCKIIKWRSKWA